MMWLKKYEDKILKSKFLHDKTIFFAQIFL